MRGMKMKQTDYVLKIIEAVRKYISIHHIIPSYLV